MKKENVKIIDLNLWDENPRFPEEYFRKTEKELIEYLFSKKGESEKIIELAKSIIDNFELTPWENLIIWDSEKKKITLEGNRRLMVYKILLNADLISDPKIKKIFKDGKTKTKISNDFSVDCLVTDNRELCLRYVELKHLESGYKGWGSPEKANFERRRGKNNDSIILKTEIHKIVRDLDIPIEIKERVLGHGFVTTFDRLLLDQVAKDYFKFEIKNKKLFIKDAKFQEKLGLIIWNLIKKKAYKEIFDEQKIGEKDKLDSRTLNKKENRKKYLESMDSRSVKKAKEEIANSIEEKENLFGEKTKKIQTGQGKIITNPKNTGRNTLIPNNRSKCSLKIDQDKINLIFRELREDLFLDKTINAVGVLFRVFLESTIDYFAEQEGFIFSKDIKLKGKITKVADYLEDKHKVDKERLKNIRKVATQNPSILSIQNFHDYVHEIKVTPKPADLIFKWNELQEFFEIIYNEILIHKK
ncbi:hypothetical protein KAR28_01865 [Candidatus Parcubacteria bacterium]|nr:hypothetical protein [Candidatus Parcubacteria bacterium]